MTKRNMSDSWLVMGIIAIVAGVLVLVWPDLVRWIIGISFIVWGLLTIINRR